MRSVLLLSVVFPEIAFEVAPELLYEFPESVFVILVCLSFPFQFCGLWQTAAQRMIWWEDVFSGVIDDEKIF